MQKGKNKEYWERSLNYEEGCFLTLIPLRLPVLVGTTAKKYKTGGVKDYVTSLELAALFLLLSHTVPL